MNNERAKQIVESLGVIEVLYNGSPVWIDNINGDTADVSYIGTNNKAEVDIKSLIEKRD